MPYTDEDHLTIEDSGSTQYPSTTAPTAALHIKEEGGKASIDDLEPPPQIHIAIPAMLPRFIACEHCEYHCPLTSARLYCSQCGAVLG